MTFKALIAALFASAALVALAQPPTQLPAGWLAAGSNPAEYVMSVEDDVDGVTRVATLASRSDESIGFGTLAQHFDAKPYRNQRVRFAALVRSRDVASGGALWMRVDRESTTLAFDNMDDRSIKGTTGWKRYEVVLNVADDATTIALGIMLHGEGKLWTKDVTVKAVDASVPVTSRVTKVAPTPTNLNFTK